MWKRLYGSIELLAMALGLVLCLLWEGRKKGWGSLEGDGVPWDTPVWWGSR